MIWTLEGNHTAEFDFVDGTYWDAEPEYFDPDWCVGSITPPHGDGPGHYWVDIDAGGFKNPYCRHHLERDFYFYGTGPGGACQLTITLMLIP